jgi:hypothetical protein
MQVNHGQSRSGYQQEDDGILHHQILRFSKGTGEKPRTSARLCPSLAYSATGEARWQEVHAAPQVRSRQSAASLLS